MARYVVSRERNVAVSWTAEHGLSPTTAKRAGQAAALARLQQHDEDQHQAHKDVQPDQQVE
jgi:hypothetical protein